MCHSNSGISFPPEIQKEIASDELDALTTLWEAASLCDIDVHDMNVSDEGDEDWILDAAGHMLQSLRSKGVLAPAPVRFLRMPRIVPLRPWQGFSAIAACIVVLVAIGLTLNRSTIDAPRGEMITHELEDGTNLLLNSGTRLRVNQGFNSDTREVTLVRGEVFFDVAHHADSPFIVHTPHGQVEVMGTSFSVRYWPSDTQMTTDVAVESGTVRVASISGDKATLTAGSAVTMDTAIELAHDASHKLSWTQRSFKFSDRSTGDLLEELERRHDVDIQVKMDGLKSMRSGILIDAPEGPEQILRDICELHGCVYELGADGRSFELSAP